MKQWLCKENDEEFVIEAATLKEAQAAAALYGGVVIREWKRPFPAVKK